MIRAVVLDVDGVIIGDQIGINFPDPHKDVIEVLKRLRESGVYVCLCTGRPAFSIEKIIVDAHLNNLHIIDGGAAGIDPIDKKVGFEYTIKKNEAKRIAEVYLQQDVYMAFFTYSDYFIIRRLVNEYTNMHKNILQKEAVIVDDIEEIINRYNFIKILLTVNNDERKEKVVSIFNSEFGKDLELNWTYNANALPWKLGLVTSKGLKKENEARSKVIANRQAEIYKLEKYAASLEEQLEQYKEDARQYRRTKTLREKDNNETK